LHIVDAGIVSFAANCSNKVLIDWGGPFVYAQQNSYCLKHCMERLVGLSCMSLLLCFLPGVASGTISGERYKRRVWKLTVLAGTMIATVVLQRVIFLECG
jgi:hypothetical protein